MGLKPASRWVRVRRLPGEEDCRHEEHTGHRHLTDDQQLSGPGAPIAATTCRGTPLEHGRQIKPRGRQCRSQTEQHDNDERRREGERQDAPVEVEGQVHLPHGGGQEADE